jgi:hypothetical protein
VDDDSQLGNDGRGKRPWFGPRAFGFGLAPQTWQGVLVVAALVLLVVAVVSATGGHSPLIFVAVAVAIGIPLLINQMQRR